MTTDNDHRQFFDLHASVHQAEALYFPLEKGVTMDNDATSGQISVTVPGTLLAQIDAFVGSSFVDRDEFVRAAIRHYVEYLQATGRASGAGSAIG